MDLQVRGQIALVLLLGFSFIAFVVRGTIQYRRTGRTGIAVGRMGGTWAERVVLASLVIGAALIVVTVAAALAGSPLAGPDDIPAGIVAVAVVVAVMAIAASFWAQLAMGDSWRVGVDTGEHTALVTGGPYRSVRNPIYTAMFAFFAAIAVLLPGVASVVAFAFVVVAIEYDVRYVEEPWLHAEHGADFDIWAAHAGRFVPAIGRLSAARPHAGTAQ